MSEGIPHDKRNGWLKNGNPPGDFATAPRCGARNRKGVPCQCPAMANGRCRLHGGLSTGPKSAVGIECIRRVATKHGRYSMREKAERTKYRALIRACRELLGKL
jgi:hypothetical protein